MFDLIEHGNFSKSNHHIQLPSFTKQYTCEVQVQGIRHNDKLFILQKHVCHYLINRIISIQV